MPDSGESYKEAAGISSCGIKHIMLISKSGSGYPCRYMLFKPIFRFYEHFPEGGVRHHSVRMDVPGGQRAV